MAVKLDVSKAFDNVEWSFLDAVMSRMGFGETWRNWIMKCVTSVTYSVLINGSPTPIITPHRGITQGDPISPFLYLLCTEGLSCLIQARVRQAKLSGFQASHGGPAVSHLFFADDSLLFLKANTSECMELLNVLHDYQLASGQEINYHKSAITFAKGTSHHTQTSICSYIAERMYQKLASWYSKLLSPAGKETLIKSIVTSLPTYAMSCFLLPNRLLNQLTTAIQRFWWSNDLHTKKLAWVSWNKITQSKGQGGLGIRDLRNFNIALLAKQGWRLLQNPQSLLDRMYKAKYYKYTSFFNASCPSHASAAWRSINQAKTLLKHGTRWQVGNGKHIKVWSDNWLPAVPPRPARSPGVNAYPSLHVCDLLVPHSGAWDKQKLSQLLHPEDVSLVLRIRPSQTNGSDYLSWIYTTSGDYSVKSGYHVQMKEHNSEFNSTVTVTDSKLYSQVWKLDVHPKLKHFWWRIIQRSLPVGDALARRGCRCERQCPLCGEMIETVNHLLFQCRLSREVWELAPLPTPTNEQLCSYTLQQNLLWFFTHSASSHFTPPLFPFLGWRIWKMRNSLVFRHQKEFIPPLINRSLMDHAIWRDSKQLQPCLPNTLLSLSPSQEHNSLCQLMAVHRKCCCTVDASWVSPNHCVGIAWMLFQNEGQCILKGSGSLDPISTPAKAEALALFYAVRDLRRLAYRDILFVGDCKTVYHDVQSLQAKEYDQSRSLSVTATIVCDIVALASPSFSFSFSHVQRSLIGDADQLARFARQEKLTYTTMWSPV